MKDTCHHSSMWQFAEHQRSQYAPELGTGDAHGYDPELVIGT